MRNIRSLLHNQNANRAKCDAEGSCRTLQCEYRTSINTIPPFRQPQHLVDLARFRRVDGSVWFADSNEELAKVLSFKHA